MFQQPYVTSARSITDKDTAKWINEYVHIFQKSAKYKGIGVYINRLPLIFLTKALGVKFYRPEPLPGTNNRKHIINISRRYTHVYVHYDS